MGRICDVSSATIGRGERVNYTVQFADAEKKLTSAQTSLRSKPNRNSEQTSRVSPVFFIGRRTTIEGTKIEVEG